MKSVLKELGKLQHVVGLTESHPTLQRSERTYTVQLHRHVLLNDIQIAAKRAGLKVARTPDAITSAPLIWIGANPGSALSARRKTALVKTVGRKLLSHQSPHIIALETRATRDGFTHYPKTSEGAGNISALEFTLHHVPESLTAAEAKPLVDFFTALNARIVRRSPSFSKGK